MQNQPNNQQQGNRPKQRIRLPFDNKAGDPGVWSYDHRIGICITLIAYLLFGIIFIAGKIQLGTEEAQGAILIEFPEEQRQQLTPEQIRMLQEQMAQDYTNIANRASNENAELNANLKDDRGTKASDLYNDAQVLDERMRSNREAYQAGLAREQAMRDEAARSKDGDGSERTDTKAQGRVTVSFSFNNPIRTSQRLVVPAYMCEGGGQVTLIVTLDHNGYVTGTSIDRSASTPDNCMQETAVKAAKGSRFNVDTSAPTKHQGTITYIFVQQ